MSLTGTAVECQVGGEIRLTGVYSFGVVILLVNHKCTSVCHFLMSFLKTAVIHFNESLINGPDAQKNLPRS